MSKSSIVIVLLLVALLASNAFWFYAAIDLGITATYRETVLEEHREALWQTLAMLPHVASDAAGREAVLAAAAQGGDEAFEKEGFVWIGRLGLRFDPAGRLIEVVPTWDPPNG